MNISRPLSLALAVSALSLIGIELKAAPIPFDAQSSGSFTAVGIPPADVFVHIDHPSVTATPFSFSNLVADEKVIFTTVPPSVLDGTFAFTDVGGFTLKGTFSGELLGPLSPGLYEVIGPFDFVGGTGLFAGASGGGQLDAMVQFLDPNGAFGISSIEWHGTLEGITCVCPDSGITLGLLGFALTCLAGLRKTRA
jgi:hypothetical protein